MTIDGFEYFLMSLSFIVDYEASVIFDASMGRLLRVLIISCVSITVLIDIVKSIEVQENVLIDNSRVEGSCMISSNNFNRSCIYHKIVYLAQKIPLISGLNVIRAPV